MPLPVIAGAAAAASLRGRHSSSRHMEVRIEGSMKPILRDLDREVVKKHVPAAISTAINRTVRSLRTRITREVSKQLRVKSKVIRRRIRIKRASRRKPRAVIGFLITHINAYVLGARETKKGVRVSKRGTIPSAFIARGRSTGRKHVLKRTSPKRYPIRIQYVPIDPEGERTARRVVAREGGPLFVKEFNRDLTRRLKRIGPASRVRK